MLKIYLTTVVIWMIILWATAKITAPVIKEKNWIKSDTSTKRGKCSIVFTLAAVPVIRLLVWVFLFVMCVYTHEELEELINKR
jgi:hypothetical protein